MPRIHPKPELLEGLTGALPEARRRILRHLRTCAICAARQASPRGDRVLEWRPRDSEYEAVVDRVLRDVQPQFAAAEREREEAPLLLAELLRHPPGRRRVLVLNSRRFCSAGLCAYVLDYSRQRLLGDLRQAEELAALGLLLAEGLAGEDLEAGRIEDLRARGWIVIANARRAAADLHGADRAFLRAEDHLRRGTGDCLPRSDLLIAKSSLRRSQCRFDEAVRMLRRGLSIYLWAGEARRAAEALVSWALVCDDTGEPERAVRLIHGARALAARA